MYIMLIHQIIYLFCNKFEMNQQKKFIFVIKICLYVGKYIKWCVICLIHITQRHAFIFILRIMFKTSCINDKQKNQLLTTGAKSLTRILHAIGVGLTFMTSSKPVRIACGMLILSELNSYSLLRCSLSLFMMKGIE